MDVSLISDVSFVVPSLGLSRSGRAACLQQWAVPGTFHNTTEQLAASVKLLRGSGVVGGIYCKKTAGRLP
jgi:hypothetical protein